MPSIAQEAWYEAQRVRRNQRKRFIYARNAEIQYRSQLKSLARMLGTLAQSFDPDQPRDLERLESLLTDYAGIIEPWARNTATRMLADVSRRDEKAWMEQASEISQGLREEIASAPTGQAMKALLDEQVSLITSLPLEAAKRVHELAIEAVTTGNRGSYLRKMIMATGEVAASRAELIARTETARATTTLTQARAQWIGSEGYIWRNVGDADVRPALGTKNFSALNTLARGSHRKLEGTFHRWDQPPIAGERGERAHPGCIYNCRCFPEVVFPRSMNAA